MKLKNYFIILTFACAVLYGAAHFFTRSKSLSIGVVDEHIDSQSSKVTITTIAYAPVLGIKVTYPQVSGCSNDDVQGQINQFLGSMFIENNNEMIQAVIDGVAKGQTNNYYHAGFKAEQIDRLLVIERYEWASLGGWFHGCPSWQTYHIDLKTGKHYFLKDLFKQETNYLEYLRTLLNNMRLQFCQQNEGYDDVREIKEVLENQDFVITKNGIKIYYHPYEIACYAAGFPAFDIPFVLLSDYLDTQGAFYRAFEKERSKNNSKEGVSFNHPHDTLY